MPTTQDLTAWEPAKILSPSLTTTNNVQQTPFSIIILNQPLSLRPTIYQSLFQQATYTIAADGGANRLHDFLAKAGFSSTNDSLPLSVIIGDLDSLRPDVRSHFSSRGVSVIHDGDQYSTDFGKAVHWLRGKRRSRRQQEEESDDDASKEEMDVVVLGGLGGRIDQGLSVLHHLCMFQSNEEYSLGKMYLLSSESLSFILKSGKHRVRVKQDALFDAAPAAADDNNDNKAGKLRWGLGKHIGIVPLKGLTVISTTGLEWDVKDWETQFGGQVSTSNWVKEEWVEVETTEDVLFTIDLKFEGDGEEVEEK